MGFETQIAIAHDGIRCYSVVGARKRKRARDNNKTPPKRGSVVPRVDRESGTLIIEDEPAFADDGAAATVVFRPHNNAVLTICKRGGNRVEIVTVARVVGEPVRHPRIELIEIRRRERVICIADVHAIDPKLLDQLYLLQQAVAVGGAYQVISGYRSAATNEKLRGKSNGVARKSLHMLGKAVDIRLPGCRLQHLRNAALALSAGEGHSSKTFW